MLGCVSHCEPRNGEALERSLGGDGGDGGDGDDGGDGGGDGKGAKGSEKCGVTHFSQSLTWW